MLVAGYTLAAVALLGGGDGDEPAAQRPANADERAVEAAFDGLTPENAERGDRADFRTARLRTARCDDGTCRVVYTIGVPGMGLILEQQQLLIERIFRRTELERVIFDVRREKGMRLPGDPVPDEEPTPSGMRLLVLTCDRGRDPAIDVATQPGDVLQRRLCTLAPADQGAQRRPPNERAEGQGGDGAAEAIPTE